MKTIKDSQGKEYQIVNGMSFKKETPARICGILSTAANEQPRKRFKIYYGDIKTGKDWGEENDTIGMIGRSTGSIKIPLLIKTSRSYGGGAILDDCILKIKDVQTGETLYQHPKYKAPVLQLSPGSGIQGYTHEVNVNGELYSRHKSERSAKMLMSKLS